MVRHWYDARRGLKKFSRAHYNTFISALFTQTKLSTLLRDSSKARSYSPPSQSNYAIALSGKVPDRFFVYRRPVECTGVSSSVAQERCDAVEAPQNMTTFGGAELGKIYEQGISDPVCLLGR
jgi:hypothetical protein